MEASGGLVGPASLPVTDMAGTNAQAAPEAPEPTGRALRKRPAPEEAPADATRPRRHRKATAKCQGPALGATAAPPSAADATAAPPSAVDASAAAAAEAQRLRREAEADALRAQLVEAHAVFQEQRGAEQRGLWLEVDVAAALSPRSLVHRQVRIYWGGDDAWYLAEVVGYNSETGKHEVRYSDGSREALVLALERVRLLVRPGERLLPRAGPLRVYVQRLRALGGDPAFRGHRDSLERRAEQLMQLCERLEAQEAASFAPPRAPSAPSRAPSAEASPAASGQAAGWARPPPPQQQQQSACPAASGAPLGPAEAPAPAQPALLPGEVGWFKVTGFPHWPFMCITREEAMHRGVQASHFRSSAHLGAHFFGTSELMAVNPAAVEKSGRRDETRGRQFATFLEGLEQGYHAPLRGRKMAELRAAFWEVAAYFREGELPPNMAPRHNDGLDVEDEAEGAAAAASAFVTAAAAAKPARRRKPKAAGGTAAAAPALVPAVGRLPLQLNAQLTLLALGEIDWLHPAFHNEKYIFPVGFKACRLTKTPASGGEAAPHLMEILRAPDGSGPLFRVTPRGGQPAEGPTASKAWQALYAGDAAGQARSLGLSGFIMFGLSLDRVRRAIHALPGAARCKRYCGWPEGEQPEAPPLTEEELRLWLAFEAAMHPLPAGVTGVPAPPAAAGVCHVCGEEEEDEEDLIVQCDQCRVFVHMGCYGVAAAPNGSLWLCDVCSLRLARPPPCALCPVLGGALKRTTCGRWAHPACALWIPETSLVVGASHHGLRGLIQGVQQVHRSRFQLACKLCAQPHGACVQCCEPRCYVGFHPLCARMGGLHMEMHQESDCESEEEEAGEEAEDGGPAAQQGEAAAQPEQQQQQQQQQQQCGAREGSCDENDAAAPNSSRGDSQQCGAASTSASLPPPAAAAAPRPRRRAKRGEGTLVGQIRLMAFCPKHRPVRQPRYAPAAAATGLLHPSLSEPVDSDEAQAQPQQWQQQQQQREQQAGEPQPPPRQQSAPCEAASAATSAGAAPLVRVAGAPPPPPPWSSARSRPFSNAARRGQRAPEAAAAAEAKRGAVLSLPYLVRGPQPGLRPAPSSPGQRAAVCTGASPDSRPRRVTYAPASACLAPPPGAAGRYVDGGGAAPGRQEQQQQQAQQAQQQQQQQPQQQQQQEQQQQEQQQQEWLARLPAQPLLQSPGRGARVRSEGDRYAEMMATLGRRVTIGKSGIHGWGAFAKRRHDAHEMVVEYVGQLVRPSVADLREARCYDGLVGAGTYVFRLNRALCVDATRAGNLAHLLNHSCDPNCYSRTVSIGGHGGVVDHVVISALREIEAGEELTYDYRFCGEEQLPCNCGAVSCRGRVNEKPPDWADVWAPRSQLRSFRGHGT